jgi:thiol-disulfide isomerase/thioredoxin
MGYFVPFILLMETRCSHCKQMARDWDRLAEKWKGHTVGLVAEVDCTDHVDGGKKLCNYLGIESFPTLKYGEPHDLDEYEGGRSFEELAAFAEENLVPVCSVQNLEKCDDSMTELLKNLLAKDQAELQQSIEEEEKKLELAQAKFQKAVDNLTKQYEAAEIERRKAIDGVMEGHLGLMRQVMAARAKQENNKSDTKNEAKEEL